MIGEVVLKFSKEHYHQMLAHVKSCLPEEACGLMGGKDDLVQSLFLVTNELHSAVRYRLDPAQLLAAFMRLDELGEELLGVFHSHPTGPAVPSETDIAQFYYPGVCNFIWSQQAGEWVLRGFDIDGQVVQDVQWEYLDSE